MEKNNSNQESGKLSFEEAVRTLTEIVTKIEQGQIPLEESLDQYEKGMGLIKHCRGILQEAEKRIDRISQGTDDKNSQGQGELL